MKAPAIALPGRARAALPLTSRWRALLGALLLTLTPGLGSAGAAESEDWPTAPDNGPRAATRIPWMTFSGDPSASAVGHTMHAHEVVVVREHEPTRRERRLLRRAERHAAKAAKLRERSGPRSAASTVLVPVVHTAPPAPPAPPPTVVVERGHPQVRVVRLAQAPAHEHDDCDEDDAEASGLAAELEALAAEADALEENTRELHAPVVIDVERLSEDVQRQVERAHREAERAHEQAERALERAERARERSHRDAGRSRGR